LLLLCKKPKVFLNPFKKNIKELEASLSLPIVAREME